MIYSLKEKEGMLRLYHRKESIAEAAYCSYFGLRQKSYRFEAETAGLVLYQNHENHLRMEIAKKQEQKVFRVVTLSLIHICFSCRCFYKPQSPHSHWMPVPDGQALTNH